MTKIFIDAIGIQLTGGGRTSIFTLLHNVFKLDHETHYVVLLSAPEPAWEIYPNVEQRVMRGSRFAVRLAVQSSLTLWARRERAGLVHFTKNLGAFALPCPYVVTVHDLTTLVLRQQHTWLDVAYWRWLEPLTVRRAAKVVAVSQTTAADIERFYGIPAQSVDVVYWAAPDWLSPVRDVGRLAQFRERYSLPDRYILSLGIRARKKNLPTLLRALALLHERGVDCPDLVAVGRNYPQSADTESADLVESLGLSRHVHYVGSVPDEDLAQFYSGSELYVYPSLHEGFGIPCLEAMACGTPIIISPSGALPEIAGDAALVMRHPTDVDGLADLIQSVLLDAALRQDLIQRGFRRAGQFSWERSAQQMLDIYRRAMEG